MSEKFSAAVVKTTFYQSSGTVKAKDKKKHFRILSQKSSAGFVKTVF